MKMGEELSEDAKNEEQAIAGIRDDDVWQNGMSMLEAVAEYAHDTEVVLDQVTIAKVDDISAIVVHGCGKNPSLHRPDRLQVEVRIDPFMHKKWTLMKFLYELTCKIERFFLL